MATGAHALKKYVNDAFAKDLMDYVVLQKGFGVMNKNDYETLLMFLLMKHSPEFSSKSEFEKSIILQLPETKVRRLIYEGNLKYGTFQAEEAQNIIAEYLKDRECLITKDKVQFNIEDKFLHDYVISLIKKEKLFVDVSLYKDSISMTHESYAKFITSYFLTEEDCKEIEKKTKKSLKEDIKKFLQETIRDFLKEKGKDGLQIVWKNILPMIIKALPLVI